MNPSSRAVSLRPASPADAPGVAAIYRPVVRDTAISFETDPPDAAEIGRRIASGARYVPWLVAVDGDGVAGFAYAAPFRSRPAYRWTTETTVYVDAGRQRRGIGRLLMRRLLDDLAGRGFRTVIAVVTLPNDPSVALHESLGFRPIGVFPRAGHKFGRWRDTGWWSLDLAPGADDRADPPSPRLGGGGP